MIDISQKKKKERLGMIIFALNSSTRRKILRLLVQGPMNVKEVFNGLSKEGLRIKYPESAYKSLEILVDCDLVEKYYDRERGLLYKLVSSGVEIDFSEL